MTTTLVVDDGNDLGSGAPALLIVASDAEGRLAAHSAARDIGARVLATLTPLEARTRLAESAGQEVVLYEMGRDDAPDIAAALITQINAEAEAGHVRGVIVVPRDAIDLAAALAPCHDVELLSEPETFDRQAALAIACAPRRYAVNDVGSENGLIRLVQLGEEVGRIARSLANLGTAIPVMASSRSDEALPPEPGDAPPITAATVRQVIRLRRARDQFFRADLFADPAWDMLLDLFAAHLDQQRVSVSSLCIAAAVPPTTALRWIKAMTDEALLVRRADATDGRRIFIELGAPSAEAMSRYFRMLTSGALGRL